jgi:hypothetical protein
VSRGVSQAGDRGELGEVRGRAFAPTGGECQHQQVGARGEVVAGAGVRLALDHHHARRRRTGLRRSRRLAHAFEQTLGRVVVPVVQHVRQHVGVVAAGHRGERVARHDLEPIARRGAGRHLGELEQGAREVGVVVEQHAEQRTRPPADVTDAAAGRPVERPGEQEAVHPSAGGHRPVEGGVPVGVLDHPREEGRAVRRGERVAVGREPGVEVLERGGHLAAGGELDPRPPAARVVPPQEGGRSRRPDAIATVDAQPPAGSRVTQQPLQSARVAAELAGERRDPDRGVEAVRQVETAQRGEHGEIEPAERSLQETRRRRSRRPVAADQSGTQPCGRPHRRGRRERGHAEDLLRSERHARPPVTPPPRTRTLRNGRCVVSRSGHRIASTRPSTVPRPPPVRGRGSPRPRGPGAGSCDRR